MQGSTHLFCQSICDDHMVIVVSFVPQQTGDIGWPCCPWLIFQTSEICFHLILVDFYLDLIGEFDVGLGEWRHRVRSAINHGFNGFVLTQPFRYIAPKVYRGLDRVSCGITD